MIASVKNASLCMRPTTFTSLRKYFHKQNICLLSVCEPHIDKKLTYLALCYPSILFPRAVGLFLAHFCVSRVVFICLAVPDIEFYRINFGKEDDCLSARTLEPFIQWSPYPVLLRLNVMIKHRRAICDTFCSDIMAVSAHHAFIQIKAGTQTLPVLWHTSTEIHS